MTHEQHININSYKHIQRREKRNMNNDSPTGIKFSEGLLIIIHSCIEFDNDKINIFAAIV